MFALTACENLTPGLGVINVGSSNASLVGNPLAPPLTPVVAGTPPPQVSPTPVSVVKTTSTLITMPIEVFDGLMGNVPSVLPVSSCRRPVTIAFGIDSVALAKTAFLYLQVHGVKYSREASIQINPQLSTKTPWVSLMNPDELAPTKTTQNYSPANPNLQVLGPASNYGGIGGAFTILKLKIGLNDGHTFGERTTTPLQLGNNQISFCFNGSDGKTSGYRVIDLGLLDSSGKAVTDAAGNTTLKTQLDNPEQWKSPVHQNGSAANAANGASLWTSAALQSSRLSTAFHMRAKCVDCHTQSGSDLYYFNYSNLSIIERAIHHGLSYDQGADIAAFIRALPNLTNPGRPWNPPFQPGARLDSLPVADWSAGAGASAILDRDHDAFSALAKSGKKGSDFVDPVSRTLQYKTSVREFPLAFQFPDWNEWLPTLHPMDALNISNPSQSQSYNNFMSGTAAANGFNGYETIRKSLATPTSAYLYSGFMSDVGGWCGKAGRSALQIDVARAYAGIDASTGLAINGQKSLIATYSVSQLSAVKMWEFHHDFPAANLESVGRAIFGTAGERASWSANNRCIFDVSPHASSALLVNFNDYQLIGDLDYRSTHPQYSKNHPLSTSGLNDPRVYLTENYLASAWYELHMTLNPGNHLMSAGGHGTTDWGYMAGFSTHAYTYTGAVEPMRMARFDLNAMRQHDNDLGPTDPAAQGFDIINHMNPRFSGIVSSGPQFECKSQACATTQAATPSKYLSSDWNSSADYLGVPQTLYQIWLERAAQFSPEELISVRGPYNPDGTISPPGEYLFWSYVNPAGYSSTGDAADYFHRGVVDAWDGNPGYLQQLKALRDQMGSISVNGSMQQASHTAGAVVNGLVNVGQLIWPGSGNANPWNAYRSPAGSISAPIHLEATPATLAGAIQLNWSALGNASSYNVKRTTNPNLPYQTVAYFLATPSYLDPNLVAGTHYYYKVSANIGAYQGAASDFNSLEGADSQAVSATAEAGMIGDWTWDSATSGDGSIVTNAVPNGLNGTVIKQALADQSTKNGFLSLPRNLSRVLANTATITAWVKVPQGSIQSGALTGAGTQGLAQWGALTTTGFLTARFSCVNGDANNAVTVKWPTSLADSQWHFVAMSRNGVTGMINISVDGVTPVKATGGIGTCPSQIRSLGRMDGVGQGYGQGAPFSGDIHRMRVYNESLTDAQLTGLYHSAEKP